MSPIILVVEDDDDLRTSIENVLTDRAYTVYSAPQGSAALALLQSAHWRPDLIVSDIMMPLMNGYEFFEAVHGIADFRAIPFIFLTARGTKADQQIALKMGVDGYLIKPFEPEDFILAIENKLRRQADMRHRATSELDEARRTMVQLLSHELRTPLTYVSGGWQLLLEELSKKPMNSDTEMSIGLIGNGTARLTRLTEQMVLYAQLVAGHVHVQLESVGASMNMRWLVQATLDALSTLITDRQIQVHLDFTDELVYVFGVSDLMIAGLGEVIRNAIAYSPEGGPIWVVMQPGTTGLMIEVTDRGSGIIADDLPHIWNILVQSDRQRREQQGAGMGLPIARRVIEAHGGTIMLESQIDYGTRVTIELPLE